MLMFPRVCSLLFLITLLTGCGGETPAPSDTEPGETAKSVETSGKTETVDKPDDPLLERAELHLGMQEYQLAIEALSHVIASDPENFQAYLKRAGAYAAMQQDANALADYSTCIRLDKENSKLYNARGHFLFMRKHLDEALKDFSEAVRLDDQCAEAFNNRGLIYLALKKYDKAVADFDAAVKVNDEYAEALNNRGFAHMQQKKIQEAFRDFNAVLKVDPKNVSAYNNRGLTWYHAGKYEEAVKDLTAAIELRPTSPKYLLHRRNALMKMGRTKEAQADLNRIAWLNRLNQLNQIVASQPLQPLPYVMRAEHAAQAGDTKQAMADFTQALQLNPEFIRARLGLASQLVAQKKSSEAIEHCNQVLRIESNQQAFSIRGDAHAESQQYELAVNDYDRAKRFDPAVAGIYLKWSEQLRKKGDVEKAEVAYQHALKLDPSLATASSD